MPPRPSDLSTEQLVAEFVALGVAQGPLLEALETARYNRLFDRQAGLLAELKRRDGDERRLLPPLLDHADIQVRMNAAKATYAIDPEAARATLQSIASSGRAPWAAHAGMTLWSLDEGLGRLD